MTFSFFGTFYVAIHKLVTSCYCNMSLVWNNFSLHISYTFLEIAKHWSMSSLLQFPSYTFVISRKEVISCEETFMELLDWFFLSSHLTMYCLVALRCELPSSLSQLLKPSEKMEISWDNPNGASLIRVS